MGHGIFPAQNKYYLASEIFPFLSKQEKKEVYFPEKKPKNQNASRSRFVNDEEDQASKFRKK